MTFSAELAKLHLEYAAGVDHDDFVNAFDTRGYTLENIDQGIFAGDVPALIELLKFGRSMLIINKWITSLNVLESTSSPAPQQVDSSIATLTPAAASSSPMAVDPAAIRKRQLEKVQRQEEAKKRKRNLKMDAASKNLICDFCERPYDGDVCLGKFFNVPHVLKDQSKGASFLCKDLKDKNDVVDGALLIGIRNERSIHNVQAQQKLLDEANKKFIVAQAAAATAATAAAATTAAATTAAAAAATAAAGSLASF